MTSLGTVAFMWALDSLNDLLLWLPRIANQAQTGAWWLLVLFAVPVVGGLLVGLICRTLPNSSAWSCRRCRVGTDLPWPHAGG